MAYHIPSSKVEDVKGYLDIREVNGYSIQYTTFYPSSPARARIENCMLYIGLPSNPQFLGVQDQQDLAERIVGCRGPSGENVEYLFMLRDALAELSDGEEDRDEHVQDLARRVELLIAHREGDKGDKGSSEQAVENEMQRVKSAGTSHESEETDEKEKVKHSA
ncbi:MAG: hypothetical protein Q9174_006207 [Haloplaca sp. 1 TL-2023]